MESESGENVGFFWMLRKPLLVRFCFVVWALFSIFPIFWITSFGVCTRPQHQDTTKIFCCLPTRKKKKKEWELHGYVLSQTWKKKVSNKESKK